MRDPVDELIDYALLDRDEGERPPPPAPKGIWGALNTKWTTYKGVHKPCDACVELIHEMGTGRAPHPQPARLKRTGPNGDRFLCNEHAEQHKRLDHQVTAEKKAAEDADQRTRQSVIAARARASSRTRDTE
jgi:hypothetical protein